MSPLPGYITVKEAAERWSVGISRVHQYIREKRIQGVIKAGGARFIPEKTRKPSGPAGRPVGWRKNKEQGS